MSALRRNIQSDGMRREIVYLIVFVMSASRGSSFIAFRRILLPYSPRQSNCSLETCHIKQRRIHLFKTPLSSGVCQASFSSSQIDGNSGEQILETELKSVDESNWRIHPSLSESYVIPTVLVKNDALHKIMRELNPYLATRMKEFEDVHPRLKAIQDAEMVSSINEFGDSVNNMKAILLDPNSISEQNFHEEKPQFKYFPEDLKEERQKALEEAFPKLSDDVIKQLVQASAFPGPIISKTIPYAQQPLHRLLSKLLPKEAQPPPTGFEQIGHVIHLNLKEKHFEHRKMIGSVILDRLSPKIKTVVNKVGEVSGPYRTYDMEVLAGTPEMLVEVVEDGVNLNFDLSKVYWCTRLSGERSRLLNDEFREGQIVADAFCGVGALCVLAASKLGCTVHANDLNPDAVRYMKESAKKNKRRIKSPIDVNEVAQNMPPINVNCGDAFDFIQNLGSLPELPHHVVMNYPLDSPSFLGAFRWWPASDGKLKDSPTQVHLYTFARGDDPKGELGQGIEKPRNAIDVAIDLVADGLMPEGGAIEKSRFRKTYLDKLGCDVKAHEVRDVAPGKVVICVTFKISPLLLRVMQGDFIDID